MATNSPTFIIIGKSDHSRLPNGMVVGIGSTVVSQLRKKNLTEYRDADNYPVPTTVTITQILSEDKVKVRDIFGKEYETKTRTLEPVLYELIGFKFYRDMQTKAKQLETQLGGSSTTNDYYQKYMKYKTKYSTLQQQDIS